ncbi:MAG TPA: MaoC/PaaZ C-terminal domain-containing protein [bacterium]|nr:MaoC/PaaZ C-terminal domain-containing protein [bacterium]
MAAHVRIDDLHVGWKRTWRRIITQADMEAMIRLSGDQGGYHVDESFARRVGFRTVITPGLLQASMVTKLGGDINFLAREVTFSYLKPVYVGDELEVVWEVLEVEREKNRIRVRSTVTNQAGEQVLDCHGFGYMPRPEWGQPIKPPLAGGPP